MACRREGAERPSARGGLLRRGRWLAPAIALVALLGCAAMEAERQESREAWQARDEERARGCARGGGYYFSGTCVSAGGGR